MKNWCEFLEFLKSNETLFTIIFSFFLVGFAAIQVSINRQQKNILNNQSLIEKYRLKIELFSMRKEFYFWYKDQLETIFMFLAESKTSEIYLEGLYERRFEMAFLFPKHITEKFDELNFNLNKMIDEVNVDNYLQTALQANNTKKVLKTLFIEIENEILKELELSDISSI